MRTGAGRERTVRPRLGSYRVQQRQIIYRAKAYQFVSYEGLPADTARGHLASAAAWYLMSGGKRWEVMPQLVGQDEAELDQSLLEWLKETIR